MLGSLSLPLPLSSYWEECCGRGGCCCWAEAEAEAEVEAEGVKGFIKGEVEWAVVLSVVVVVLAAGVVPLTVEGSVVDRLE